MCKCLFSITLLFQFIFISPLYSQVYEKGWFQSYKSGVTDVNGKYLGGSTIVHLVGHKGKLYAGNSYWCDSDNPWFGGKVKGRGWAQVMRLDKPNGQWKEDLYMGPHHLRVEILKSVTFRYDSRGRRLKKPVNLLLASEYSPKHKTTDVNVFTRDDNTGKWVKTLIHNGPKRGPEDYCVRAMLVHRDRATGADRIFISIGIHGIFSGVYDPTLPGKIRWDKKSETGRVETRVLSIIEANGALMFSAGRKIYRRNDGHKPTYTLIQDMSKLYTGKASSPLGGIRGLSPIPSPTGRSHSLIFAMSEGNKSKSAIYRLDRITRDKYKLTKETEVVKLMSKYLHNHPVYMALAAYNNFHPVIDPRTRQLVHVFGFESAIGPSKVYPTWGGTFYAGGMYVIRDRKGNYRVKEINGPSTPEKPPLVATCVFAISPFKEHRKQVIYFGGHDGNSRPSHGMAWIFRSSLRTALDPAESKGRPMR